MRGPAALARGSGADAAIRVRLLAIALLLGIAALAIAAQTVRLALSRVGTETRTASAEPLTRVHTRPDILDRNGRLIATDVAGHSLFADPALLLDADEAAEKLARTLPGLDANEVRRQLADRSRRFVWLRRGLTPVEAQRVHDLGLPGLAFRREPKRVYPSGLLVGHVVGQVNADNRGIAGLERYIDETLRSEATQGSVASASPAVRLSLDLGAQHALADELGNAARRYQATGAAGLVMDAGTGEIVAAYSWPPVDPNVAGEHLDETKPDRVQGGVYELGSILKALTVAMALDDGLATLESTYDVSQPLAFGPHRVRDLHPYPGRMTVRDIFVRSSNIGAATMALEAGTERQLVFLARMGLLEPLRTEAGPIAAPLLPGRWDKVETATIAFGHGLALAPLQVAAAAASLVNGGRRVAPTYLAEPPARPGHGEAILKPATSAALRELLRLNVTLPYGTGRRADVSGYRLGGKTGTAEMPGKGGYKEKAVISSFLGAMPMDAPRYVILVSLFEPQPEDPSGGGITAGLNAAPVTGAIVARLAPILGLLPRRIEAGP
jgi:cell division protein FtsI (penicillin-binding protein 3)